MPSLTTMGFIALISTTVALVVTLAALILDMRRKRSRFVSLLRGLLIVETGALLGEILDMTGAPYGVRLSLDTVSLLLVLGGSAYTLVGITRSARTQSGNNGY